MIRVTLGYNEGDLQNKHISMIVQKNSKLVENISFPINKLRYWDNFLKYAKERLKDHITNETEYELWFPDGGNMKTIVKL